MVKVAIIKLKDEQIMKNLFLNPNIFNSKKQYRPLPSKDF